MIEAKIDKFSSTVKTSKFISNCGQMPIIFLASNISSISETLCPYIEANPKSKIFIFTLKTLSVKNACFDVPTNFVCYNVYVKPELI